MFCLSDRTRRRLVTELRTDRLMRRQSRIGIAGRLPNGGFELRDIGGARPGSSRVAGQER
jgi:hypothetical protein